MGPYYILPSEIYVLFDLRKTLETYTQIKDLNKIEHHQLDPTELFFIFRYLVLFVLNGGLA